MITLVTSRGCWGEADPNQGTLHSLHTLLLPQPGKVPSYESSSGKEAPRLDTTKILIPLVWTNAPRGGWILPQAEGMLAPSTLILLSWSSPCCCMDKATYRVHPIPPSRPCLFSKQGNPWDPIVVNLLGSATKTRESSEEASAPHRPSEEPLQTVGSSFGGVEAKDRAMVSRTSLHMSPSGARAQARPW